MKLLTAQGNSPERMSKVGSDEAQSTWQPSTDAQALAQLRSLIRAYIRGELSHTAFVMQFGVQCLTHDLATPRPLDTFPPAEVAPDQWVLTYPDGTTTDLALHKPCCGCPWCSSDYLGQHYTDQDDDHPGAERYAGE